MWVQLRRSYAFDFAAVNDHNITDARLTKLHNEHPLLLYWSIEGILRTVKKKERRLSGAWRTGHVQPRLDFGIHELVQLYLFFKQVIPKVQIQRRSFSSFSSPAGNYTGCS